ncbi:TPA: toxin [Klebsiella oxytoca]|nr:toxin [Klebsiella oxytoca]
MQTFPVLPSLAAASSRLPPLAAWQKLLTYLLEHHYGLALNDTPFGDEDVIQEHIDRSLSPMDAVNLIVERCALVRIDRNGFNAEQQEPYLTPLDVFRARHACKLALSQIQEGGTH